MKSAIICFNCKKLKKFSESYAVKITIYEYKQITVGVVITSEEFHEVKARICRLCAKKAGYKVKKIKKLIKKNE